MPSKKDTILPEFLKEAREYDELAVYTDEQLTDAAYMLAAVVTACAVSKGAARAIPLGPDVYLMYQANLILGSFLGPMVKTGVLDVMKAQSFVKEVEKGVAGGKAVEQIHKELWGTKDGPIQRPN